jgi:hypothetical protein
VTITQAGGQADPLRRRRSISPSTFGEAVATSTRSDVTIRRRRRIGCFRYGGPTTYNVAVSGMNTDGTVTISIGAGGIHDALGNGNSASVNTDNQVKFDALSPNLGVREHQQRGRLNDVDERQLAAAGEPTSPASRPTAWPTAPIVRGRRVGRRRPVNEP